MNFSAILRTAAASLVYGTLGLVIFGVAFWLIAKSLPFSLRKEIEDDQNTSLGLVIGAVIIGIAMILSAAVHG
jgi:putative membrane protein